MLLSVVVFEWEMRKRGRRTDRIFELDPWWNGFGLFIVLFHMF